MHLPRTLFLQLLIGFAPLTIGCGGFSTQLRIEAAGSVPTSPPAPVAGQYNSPMQAIYHLDFEWVNAQVAGQKYVNLAQALKLALDNRLAEAESILWTLRELPAADEEYQCFVDQVLSYLLSAEGKWIENAALNHLPKEDLDNAKIMADALGHAPVESVELSSEPVTVPFDCYASVRTPIIEVELNGQKRSFWVDTAAESSAISSDIAEELGIEPRGNGEIVAKTVTTKTVKAKPTVLPEVRIGSIVFRNHPAMIADASIMKFKLLGLFTLVKADGILGWPFIRHLAMSVDHKTKRLVLQSPRVGETQVRNLFWLGEPFVRMPDDRGVPLHFVVDTGTKRTTLFQAIEKRHPLQIDGERTVHRVGAGGMETIRSKVARSLAVTLSPYRLSFSNLEVGPITLGEPLLFDGWLGNDIALGGKMVIDFPNGRFEIRPSDG